MKSQKINKISGQIVIILAIVGLIFPLINKIYFAACGDNESLMPWIMYALIIITPTSILANIADYYLIKSKRTVSQLWQRYVWPIILTLCVTALFPWINELFYFENCHPHQFFIPAAVYNIPLLAMAVSQVVSLVRQMKK